VEWETERVLKSVAVTHNGPHEFTVKVVHDGEKLDEHGFGRGDGTDRVRRWKRVKVDEDKNSIMWVDHVPEPTMGAWIDEATEAIGECLTLTILNDPQRVEIVAVTPEGDYLSDERFKAGMQDLLNPIIQEAQQRLHDVVTAVIGPALRHRGAQSVVVNSLDKHVYYDAFFEQYVAAQRDRLESIPNVILHEPKAGEFFAINPENSVAHIVKFDLSSGEIAVRSEDEQRNDLGTTHYRVHSSPLVLEAWHVDHLGTRKAGPHLARVVQRDANQSIKKSNSWLRLIGLRRPCCAMRTLAAQ